MQLKDKRWKPDRGPSKFNPRWGATITGARKLLVTFNVNLLASKEHARIIADAIHSDKGKVIFHFPNTSGVNYMYVIHDQKIAAFRKCHGVVPGRSRHGSSLHKSH